MKGGTGPARRGGDPNDLWLYFGWSRDSDSGSGLIGVELHKLAVDAACDYANKTEQQLKDTCNPFKNRRDGDILLLWDQQGGAREVYIRVFVENPEPNPSHAGVWGPQISLTDENSPYLGTAFAQYGNGGFRGEMAVDLSKVVPPTGQECESFANVIPGTITGNSDQADYKDIVLKKFPLISNCGGLKIIKDTNPDGGTGNFDFLLTGASSIFPGDVDEDCNDADDQTQCAGTLVGDDAEVEIAGLINGTYTLTEPTLPSDYALESISCVLGEDTYTGASFPVQTGGQTVCTITNTLKTGTLRVTKQITNGFGLTSTCPDYSFKINGGDDQTWEADCSNDYTFNVGTQHTIVENGGLPSGFVFDSVTNCTNVTIVANQTVECIVKNKATQATPSLVTGQLIILHDRAHITGIRRGANDDSLQAEGSSVTFALYNGLVCAGNPVATETIPLDFPNATNTSITVGTVTGFTSPFNSLGTFSPSWSWKVIYSGNAYNAASPAATAACNEAIAITISGNGNIPAVITPPCGSEGPALQRWPFRVYLPLPPIFTVTVLPGADRLPAASTAITE